MSYSGNSFHFFRKQCICERLNTTIVKIAQCVCNSYENLEQSDCAICTCLRREDCCRSAQHTHKHVASSSSKPHLSKVKELCHRSSQLCIRNNLLGGRPGLPWGYCCDARYIRKYGVGHCACSKEETVERQPSLARSRKTLSKSCSRHAGRAHPTWLQPALAESNSKQVAGLCR